MESREINTLLNRFTDLIPNDTKGKDAIVFLIKNKIIDEKRIRNFFIRQDFAEMIKQQKRSFTYIYDDLSFKYNVSVALVRAITGK